jgi:hypothetical protein
MESDTDEDDDIDREIKDSQIIPANVGLTDSYFSPNRPNTLTRLNNSIINYEKEPLKKSSSNSSLTKTLLNDSVETVKDALLPNGETELVPLSSDKMDHVPHLGSKVDPVTNLDSVPDSRSKKGTAENLVPDLEEGANLALDPGPVVDQVLKSGDVPNADKLVNGTAMKDVKDMLSTCLTNSDIIADLMRFDAKEMPPDSDKVDVL